ncbi:MAG TPA: lipocalin-like domain-containing protein [Thermoanaerobaculia bacterium]|nr:lipocalin-like domain-containing protein [Thermoanaerobaculia bacterium]
MFAALSSAVALSLVLGSASDPRALLVGAWRVQEEIDTRADGSVVSVIPQGYAGLVIYTADGFMAATLMPKDRNWAVGTATADEMRQTLETGTAYSGRYEVDPKTHTVTHVVLTSMDPSDVGQRLSRTYALDGGSLSLSGKWTYQGEPLGFTIKFTRLKAAP